MKGMLLAGWVVVAAGLPAQTEAPPPAPASVVVPQPEAIPQLPGAAPQAPGEPSRFLGKDLPFLDPSSEVVSWDGKLWNINDNRFFRARFEKYLNAPEENAEEDQSYRMLLKQIESMIAPGNFSVSQMDKAFELLPKASNYRADANLCDALAGAVFSVWMAQDQDDRIMRAQSALEREREMLNWNARASVRDPSLQAGPSDKTNPTKAAEWAAERQMERQFRLQPYVVRLAEVEAMMKANTVKREATVLQAKLELQALLLQFFLQRRFQHVLIGSKFYRGLFGDGDTQIRLGQEAQAAFSKYSGVPPTLSVLDSLALEAIRDVAEGVDTYKFLMDKKEMASATQRLSEAFVVGEHLPEIRTLPREDKRRALAFTQKSNMLLSALEVKDYERAQGLINELQETAHDFDPAKPMAAIETAKTLSGMLLEKARNAAVSGDREGLEKELKAATEIWPRNPRLSELSNYIFAQSDLQQQALVDLDRLISQKNYRQIYDDRVRFIAATALHPDRQEQLRKVLEDMQQIEGVLLRAREVSKIGNHSGAWESVEKAIQQFPNDNQLNQERANLTTQAADFVRSIRTAQQMENQDQIGSSLSWYLEAQAQYPPSEFAREGINRVLQKLFPDDNPVQEDGEKPAPSES